MPAKKYKDLYKTAGAQKNIKQTEKNKNAVLQEVNNLRTKQEIEQLKNIISTKLKSPDCAKKAAEILRNWGLRE